jgi:hypothetical protein
VLPIDEINQPIVELMELLGHNHKFTSFLSPSFTKGKNQNSDRTEENKTIKKQNKIVAVTTKVSIRNIYRTP